MLLSCLVFTICSDTVDVEKLFVQKGTVKSTSTAQRVIEVGKGGSTCADQTNEQPRVCRLVWRVGSGDLITVSGNTLLPGLLVDAGM